MPSGLLSFKRYLGRTTGQFKRPLGRVVLDTSHFLARDFATLWLPGYGQPNGDYSASGSTAGIYINRAQSDTWLQSMDTVSPSFAREQVTGYGASTYFEGGGYRYSSSFNYWRPATAGGFQAITIFCVFSRGNADTSAKTPYHLSRVAGTVGRPRFGITADTRIYLDHITDAGTFVFADTGHQPVTGDPVAVAATLRSTTDRAIAVWNLATGFYTLASSTTNSGNCSVDATHETMGAMLASGVANSWVGDVYLAGSIPRGLSNEELRELVRAPFAMLKPDDPQYVPSGFSSFVAAAARRRAVWL